MDSTQAVGPDSWAASTFKDSHPGNSRRERSVGFVWSWLGIETRPDPGRSSASPPTVARRSGRLARFGVCQDCPPTRCGPDKRPEGHFVINKGVVKTGSWKAESLVGVEPTLTGLQPVAWPSGSSDYSSETDRMSPPGVEPGPRPSQGRVPSLTPQRQVDKTAEKSPARESNPVLRLRRPPCVPHTREES